MRQGHLLRHLRGMRRVYAARRKALIDAIAALMPNDLTVSSAVTGLHLVALFTDAMRRRMSDREAAGVLKQAGIHVQPLSQNFFRRARAWCSATGACAWRTRRHCSRESQLASAAAPAAHHPIRRCPRPCSRNKERLSRRRCIAHRAPGSSKGPVERLQISQTMRGCQVAERRPI
jgi:hypothetical protein